MNDLKRVFSRTPANRLLGLRLESVSPERAEVRMPAGEHLAQETGILHGGLLATLADTAAVYVVLAGLDEGRRPTSIEFKLNFLRPAVPDGGDLLARASRVRLGRQVAVSDVEVLQGDRLVARGLFTYLILPEAGA